MSRTLCSDNQLYTEASHAQHEARDLSVFPVHCLSHPIHVYANSSWLFAFRFLTLLSALLPCLARHNYKKKRLAISCKVGRTLIFIPGPQIIISMKEFISAFRN